MKATEKTKLIERIKTIEGLTDDERAALLGLLNETKTYGLVWEDKPEEVEERLRTELPVLKEVKSRAIIAPASADSGGVTGCESNNYPNHILIEGDNLEALTTLTYTHEGKIDVIYIDPPYNTGNKDFIYNDSFVDTEDSYRHSKWLSFMSRRLRIAKKLLSDRGVILISIDDNELANLKLLCDQLFGERNFVAKFDWRKKTGANDAKDIAVITESIICYCKDKRLCLDQKIWKKDIASRNDKRFKLEDEFVADRGRYYLDTLDRGGLSYSDSLNYGIEAPDGGIIFPHGRSSYINDGWIWKWSKSKIKWGLDNGFLVFVKSSKSKGSKYTIKYKVYELVDNEGKKREQIGRAFSNLILEPINQMGNLENSDLFDGIVPFNNPKPLGLLKYLLSTIKFKTILDFFAGSGTTLHAVMQLNAEDGGKRQCILCTNNENGICENVTYERNKRVIEGYTKPNGEYVEGLHDNNLRYYRTDFVGRRRTPQNMRRLMLLSSDMLCIKENLYTEHDMFGEMPTLENGFRYFADGKKQMLIVYNEEAIYGLINAIEVMDVENPIIVYVFSPGNDAWNVEFESVSEKVRLTALPAAIYNAYKRVLPKPKDTLLNPDKEAKEERVAENLFDFEEEGGEE